MAEVIQVLGLKELEKKLLALGEEYGYRAAAKPVRAALRKGAKVIQRSAIANVHVKTGTLKENIIVTSQGRPKPGMIDVKVTVRAKAKAYKPNARNRKNGRVGASYKDYGPLFYARFLEFGTSASAKRPVDVQPYPFLTPAFEANKGTVPGMIRDFLAIEIEKSVKKLQGIRS